MAERFEAEGVRGFLHRPAGTPRAGIVLAHGAGSNANAPLLMAACEAMTALGVLALRCDLPFRQERPKGPPRPGDAARDRQGLAQAASIVRGMTSGPVFLGGHSYGGRQASMLAAESPQAADALLLLSYPLHPPNRPEQMRTQHFPKLHVPAFFVSGTRDPFGTPEEIRQALMLIPARTEILFTGAGHDLRAQLDFYGEFCAKFLQFVAL